ncbi:MAG: hypothetical protein JWN18_322 [Parcubacteria group bacterium]|nr:hypothetical protein [Parcubacteria group bacterium]
MSRTDTSRSDVLVLQYGQLAMKYVATPSSETNQELRGIETKLGLTRRQTADKLLKLVEKSFRKQG